MIPDAFIDRMDKAEDPKKEGQKIAIEVLLELAEIPGVSGAHLMAPLNESAIPGVIEGVRAALK